MKNHFFLLVVTLISMSASSCNKTGCTVQNKQTGQIAADNNCNNIPDFQEGLGIGTAGTGSMLVSSSYAYALITDPHQTFNIGYTNSGEYITTSNGGLLWAAKLYDYTNDIYKQDLIIDLMVNGTLAQGMIDQNAMNNASFLQSEWELTRLVKSLVANNNVSELKRYLDREVIVTLGIKPQTNTGIQYPAGAYSHRVDPLTGKEVLSGIFVPYQCGGSLQKMTVRQLFNTTVW